MFLMLNENIRKYRKECGLSQEEMAVKLHVVRQTISKWETNLSVPDADMLVEIAKLLQVSVEQLLDYSGKDSLSVDTELARLNEELAKHIKEERRLQLYHQKRNLILYLLIASLTIALVVKNTFLSIGLILLCVLESLWVLYRNLALLASQTSSPSKQQFHALKLTLLFSLLLILFTIGFVCLEKLGIIGETSEFYFVIGIVITLMLFLGYISLKLPYTRFVGLRLPWTVCDEETWYFAHRIIALITPPSIMLMFVGLLMFADKEKVLLICLFLWIMIPSILSLMFYVRKYKLPYKRKK